VEDALGLPLGLAVEFTGLISWRPGASIELHADNNRPYLKQREYAAVTYLNTAGADFEGGAFKVWSSEEGGPNGGPVATAHPTARHQKHMATITPMPGRLVRRCLRACAWRDARTAPHTPPLLQVTYDASVLHSVEPVTSGERFSLAVWFTRDPEAGEDRKLLSLLNQPSHLPPPASLYAAQPDFVDIRLCRLGMLGLGLRATGRQGQEAEELLSVIMQAGDGALVDEDLQLVVNWPVLRGWWEQEAGSNEALKPSPLTMRSSSSSDTGCGGRWSGTVEIVALDMWFREGLANAVCALQFWAMHERKLHGRWGTEAVCSLHLCEGGGRDRTVGHGSSCAWLRQAFAVGVLPGGEDRASTPLHSTLRGTSLGQLLTSIRESNKRFEVYRHALENDFECKLNEWTAIDAIF
jgi:hypothetical protein